MTIQIPPDYHLELDMTLKDFRAICGTAFSVDVVLAEKEAVSGEMIIPELSKRVEAWLWLH